MSDELDLTPRTGPDEAPASGRAVAPGGPRRWVGIGIVVAVVAVGAFAVSQALGDSTFYFRNADEAVAQRVELEGQRFRLQGLVVPGTIETYPSGVAFDVTWNGVAVPVEHAGDAAELFQPDIPVVLEGQWSGTGDDALFLSDRMIVKHDETYDAENPDRVAEVEAERSREGGGAAEVEGPGDGSDAGSSTDGGEGGGGGDAGQGAGS